MRISVIIPHLNDASGLARCLDALARQSLDASDIEILVVDNGSDELPAALCARWPNVRLIKEAKPGPGHARNLAVSQARGAVLAFTDADCIPREDWLQNILAGFARSGADVLGGDIHVPMGDPENPGFVEPFEVLYAFDNESYIRKQGFSAAANLAVRPLVFDAVGGFGGVGVAEDMLWGKAATQAGYPPEYCPDVVVSHPPRPDLSQLLDKWGRQVVHQYNSLPRGPAPRLAWLVKGALMIASPIAQIPSIIMTRKLTTTRQRIYAFACLVIVRVFRGARMIRVVFSASPTFRWNDRA